ncbi:outer membrane protein transport protein [Colwellia psychrerythraea]|uniref:Membrane protein involved in aromatic hydrocarbon degradation n=1 Tax=Colwellia psychrerythraea TaxID=28229 RepID=A0A099KW35_COLPS|nr:outer membrane protein transport protein [Colwellia psychrerythraea]KGJ94949.1 membrane protein involved in aromatic hydrocarbon degradation [Colwellia psychrerythraea]
MTLKKTLLTLSLTCTSFYSVGAAFQLAEHSAAGLGRAFAGEAAIADDASVVARNPALMAQFETMEFSVTGTYVMPDVSLTGIDASNGTDPAALNNSSIAPNAIVPAMYLVMPLNDKFSLGFGTFSNFGLATEFDDDYAAGAVAGETSITTINFNTSLSYKVNDNFVIAGGLNVIYADASLVRNAGTNPLDIPVQAELANMAGDDISYGWNMGLSYDFNEKHRLGFSYRSEVKLELEGNYSNDVTLGGAIVPGAMDIALPAIMEFSGLHQLTDTLAVHYSALWTGWSSFDQLAAYVEGQDGPVFSKEENFSDSMRYALGATYQLSSKVTLRTGIAYDESPADENHMSISIPDTNRVWLSGGLNYTFDNKSSLDFGVSIVKGETQTFTETDDFKQDWTFESQGDAYLVSAQYNHVF